MAYLGATMQLPEKDRHMEGRAKLLGLLAGEVRRMLALRACAEERKVPARRTDYRGFVENLPEIRTSTDVPEFRKEEACLGPVRRGKKVLMQVIEHFRAWDQAFKARP